MVRQGKKGGKVGRKEGEKRKKVNNKCKTHTVI